MLANDIDNFGGLFAAQVHHIDHGLADDLIQGNQNQQRNEGPEAAAGGGDAFFFVELHDLHLIFCFIVAVLGFQSLDPGGHTGHLHHAFLALGADRQQNQFDGDAEEDQGQAVIAGEVVKKLQHIAEGDPNDVSN